MGIAVKEIKKWVDFIFLVMLTPLMNVVLIPIMPDFHFSMWIAYLLTLILFLGTVYIISVIYQELVEEKIGEILTNKVIHKGLSILLLVIGIGMTVGMIGKSEYLGTTSHKLFELFGSNVCWFIILSFAVHGIFVPIIEELIFRGIVFGFLKQRMSVLLCIIISSLLFGLCHSLFSIKDIAYQALFGVIVGYARYKSNGLKIPILIHAVSNIAGAIVILIL